jgi:hypothetical protein
MNYIQFKDGDKVTLTESIKDLTASEWDLEELEYDKMLEYIGKPAVIACSNEEFFDYVSIEFEDGYYLDAISVEANYSGYQIEKI